MVQRWVHSNIIRGYSWFADFTAQQLSVLQSQITALTSKLHTSEEKTKDVEKEQEDLLVLLDEVSSKRRHDKERMRQAGLDVSEDEAEDDDDEDDEE